MTRTAAMASSSPLQPVLGLIAGTGRLPQQLIEACKAANRPIFVLAFDESADPALLDGVPHAVVSLGSVGEALDRLRAANVQEIVMAGRIGRPALTDLRPDLAGVRLLGRLGAGLFAGDDAMFKVIVSFLEDEGFTVIGSGDVLKDLLAPEGVMGRIHPDTQHMADIALGFKAAKLLGTLDIGQAVVVENGYVLGLEAAEGTDSLLERCALLKKDPSGGVLIKARKPQQEVRVDLPAIGPKTIETVHACGMRGVAVEAGGSIIIDREETVARADALGVFLIGIRNE
jgi:UDP-2,3-diacylglucosamine hydrolase